MKKLSVSLKESRFVDLINKKFTGEGRKEDGTKVKTCLETEIYLKNPESDYNGLIKDRFRCYPSLYLGFSIEIIPKNVNFEDLKNFKIPYQYLAYEAKGKYEKSLMCAFAPYSKCENELEKIFKIYDESDYDEICRSISEKLKEVGELLDYIPESWSDYTTYVQGDDSYVNEDDPDYVGEYHLRLIDKDTVYNWYNKYIDGSDETDYIEYFKDDIINHYPELKNEDFIVYSYGGDNYNIALPLNINNLNNIKEYCEYAKKWFTSRRN
jgi:hypothetical protein